MGAPLVFAPMEGPVHKRGAMSEKGWFVGIQWPAALVKRKSDGNVLNVSRKKIHVYESAYLVPLDQRIPHDDDGPIDSSKRWKSLAFAMRAARSVQEQPRPRPPMAALAHRAPQSATGPIAVR